MDHVEHSRSEFGCPAQNPNKEREKLIKEKFQLFEEKKKEKCVDWAMSESHHWSEVQYNCQPRLESQHQQLTVYCSQNLVFPLNTEIAILKSGFFFGFVFTEKWRVTSLCSHILYINILEYKSGRLRANNDFLRLACVGSKPNDAAAPLMLPCALGISLHRATRSSCMLRRRDIFSFLVALWRKKNNKKTSKHARLHAGREHVCDAQCNRCKVSWRTLVSGWCHETNIRITTLTVRGHGRDLWGWCHCGPLPGFENSCHSLENKTKEGISM